jgi:hypothetical protein
MQLEELLNYMEFDYKINPNGTMSLVDLTGANLNNIESEEFKLNTDLALNVLDRLDHYIDDYFLNDFVENLKNHDEENFKAKGYDEFYYGEDIIALADEYGDAFKDDRYDLVYAIVNPETIDVDNILNKNESVKKMSKISKLTENLESLIKTKKAIKENDEDFEEDEEDEEDEDFENDEDFEEDLKSYLMDYVGFDEIYSTFLREFRVSNSLYIETVQMFFDSSEPDTDFYDFMINKFFDNYSIDGIMDIFGVTKDDVREGY